MHAACMPATPQINNKNYDEQRSFFHKVATREIVQNAVFSYIPSAYTASILVEHVVHSFSILCHDRVISHLVY